MALVLGGGPSALAYLFHNREAVALAGKSLGGQFANSANLGPQLLWDSPETRDLLEKLALPTETKEISVGYFWNGLLKHGDELGASMKYAQEAYALKTRGTRPRETYLSEGKNSYRIFRVTVEEMVAALIGRVQNRCILASATSILLKEKQVIADEISHGYDTLVSTIPAPVFLRLIDPAHPTLQHLKAFDKLYVKAAGYQVEPWMREAKDRGFSYVYVPGDDKIFHRVKVSGENYILEYTLKGGVQVVGNGCVSQKGGQIVSGEEELKRVLSDGVTTLGRYASWNRDKFHQVLKQIVKKEVKA